MPSISRALLTDPLSRSLRSPDALTPVASPPSLATPRLTRSRSRLAARGGGGGEDQQGSSDAKNSGNSGACSGAGASSGAGSGPGSAFISSSDNAAEQAEHQVGVDSTGNPVLRQTRFDLTANTMDSQGGVQRGRGSGRGSNKQLARAQSADSRVQSVDMEAYFPPRRSLTPYPTHKNQ